MLGDGVANKTVPLILCAEENVVEIGRAHV